MTIDFDTELAKFYQVLDAYTNGTQYGWVLYSDTDDGEVGNCYNDLWNLFSYWGDRLNGSKLHTNEEGIMIILSDNTKYSFYNLTKVGKEVWDFLKTKPMESSVMADMLVHTPMVEM